MNKKWTMRHVIMAISTFCTIFALVLLTVFFYLTSHRKISDESIRESTETLGRMEYELESRIHTLHVQMQTMYNEAELMGELKKKTDGEKADLKPFYFTASEYAKNHFTSTDDLVAIYIYDSDDCLVSSYRKSVVYYPNNLYESSEDTNSDKILEYVYSKDTRLLVTGYDNQAAGRQIVHLVLKLHGYTDKTRCYGYLVCDFDSSVFSDIMHKYTSSDNVIMWLQSCSDDVITTIGYSDGAEKIFADISRIVLDTKGRDNLSLGVEYDDYYLTSKAFDHHSISAFMLTPMSLALATQSTLFRTLIVTSIIMMFFTFIVSSFIAGFYSKSVEDMQKTVYRIRNGETELRLSPREKGGTKELEILGTEFNDLLDQIEKMIAEKYEYQLLMERTEYQALQAQINPHFLYNTLDTMSGIANTQGCTMVSGLCQSLSAIFRYSLDISDAPSTIENELVHVRNYLYVMDVRNGNSIQHEFDIKSEVLQDEIPRITIQPIVENSINHGLRYVKRKDKKLYIKAEHIYEGKKKYLTISIEDNGIGMDVGGLNEELSKNSISRVEKGKSIGILNVNARIKKAYGDGYGIHVYSENDNNGTRVVIKLPIRQRGEEVV
ncbi:MAG: histidine kinase [Butyrivibrio sp.]|nr:histidine kinase [Butyrivibrio sp.]